MGFLNSMNISASGMTAQRRRLDIASENITNINTTRTENGGPYRRKLVVLEQIPTNRFGGALRRAMSRGAAGIYEHNTPGVRVAEILEDQTPFNAVYDPQHPDADANGYVMLPNVDLVKEMVDSMAASRAYEANITAFNAVKLMASKALEIGRTGA